MKYILCFLVPALIFTGGISAKTKTKKQKTYFSLLEAYTQRIIPGIPGATPKTNYHFIIVWQGAKYPETFFWRGENEWLSCNMVKVHKLPGKPNNTMPGMDYAAENIAIEKIHKGDTLELTPLPGGKYPAPGDISNDAKNTLFFKTGGSGWLAFPVKNIAQKEDIRMQ